MKALKWKLIIFLITIGIALYLLYPSIVLYTSKNLPETEKIKLQKRALHLGLDLVGGMHLILEIDKSKLSKEEAKDATDRALEIIRNRVDQFGVYEPVIQKIGRDRILVQLPGVQRERAKSLIGQTAQLEFRFLVNPERAQVIYTDINNYFKKDTLSKENPFFKYLISIGNDVALDVEDAPVVKKMLKEAAHLIPQDVEFLFGPEEEYQGRTVRRLYLVEKKVQLTGAYIADARHSPYQGTDPNLQGSWEIQLRLNSKGARIFDRITGENINRRLAIILDGVVRSAPVIEERIPYGRARISGGGMNADKAKEIAIVLRSGALPAPVKIAEERSVGPTLGLDSIRLGILAALIGAAAVIIFMLIYYSVSGGIAVFALVLNIFLLLAVLSGFRATLTLPGIAGIALTVGMAVDANVLIFERIREELRTGKTPRSAVDAGYAKVIRTIIDANMTTIITAAILYWLGTGPIRGFALTLMIGLVINLLTAVYFTRGVFEWWLRRPLAKLWI